MSSRGTLALALALITFCLSNVSANGMQDRKKVGVVLCGGGAKGMAHIGALKVIEDAGIPVDIIVGTSMGSIVGGLYAIGYDSEALDSLVRIQDWKWLLSDNDDPSTLSLEQRRHNETYLLTRPIIRNEESEAKGGLVSGKNLANLFADLTIGYHDSIDFSSLPIAFACVATSMADYREVVFQSGVLPQAMRASMAIPGVFTPVRMDSLVLVDGGLKNNYPVDVARQLGADIIIGISVQGSVKSTDELIGTMDILAQFIDFNVQNKYDDNVADTDILIDVNVEGYSSASFTPKAIDSLIVRGHKAASAKWNELMALRDSLGLPEGFRPDKIERVDPSLFAEEENEASQTADEEKSSELEASIGLRFDSEELVALQANSTFTLNTKTPVVFSLTGRLGKRYMGKVEATLKPSGFCNFSLAYTFRHNDIDFYEEGSKAFNTTYNYHNLDLTFLNISGKNYMLDFAAKWENYHFNSILLSTEASPSSMPADKTLYSANARLHYNSENSGYFTTRGAMLDIKYSLYTDNLTRYENADLIQTLSCIWRVAARLTDRLTLQPNVYGRIVWGNDMPWCLTNLVGGTFAGHYVDQQMPFPGVGNLEPMEKVFVAAGAKIQERIMDNNYIVARFALALDSNKMRSILDHKLNYGLSVGWYYDSLFGPVGASLGYSNITESADLYVNIGFVF